jgi:TetR/AcrR family transcriptional repressor of nem operon
MTKEETRQKILTSASHLFRERGVKSTTVPDVMDRCGLTVGGFYKHFESKEDLFRAAMTEALGEMRKRFARMDANLRGEAWRHAIATYYLNEAHRDNRGTGCAFAALCGDLQRADDETRAWFQEGLNEVIGMFADRMEGATEDERRVQAWQFFASLLGGLIMSRSVADPHLSKAILAAVRLGETAQS